MDFQWNGPYEIVRVLGKDSIVLNIQVILWE